MTYISTMSLASPLRSTVLQAQAALTQDQTEITTGAPADLGLTLGAQTGSVLSLKSQIDQLNAYSASNSIATSRLSTTSTVLTSLLSTAQSMQSDLVTASTTGGVTSSLTTNATDALQTLISGLNTSANGESIFGGINTAQTPISSSSTVTGDANTAFQSYVNANAGGDASTLTSAQMQTFLSGNFSSLFTGSQQVWSKASDTTMQSTVSPSLTLQTSVSANNSAFGQIAQAYTMLTEFTGSNVSDSARQQVISTASSLLSSGIAGLTDVEANVGATQSQVSDADTGLSSQVTILQTHVDDLDSVDAYSLSTQVTDLQTQLQASYELTSKLQDLSLTNYLSSS